MRPMLIESQVCNLHGAGERFTDSEADRAWDMYTKTDIQEDKHAGVVFATGTPIANTIAEMYTMMRYLQNDVRREGITAL